MMNSSCDDDLKKTEKPPRRERSVCFLMIRTRRFVSLQKSEKVYVLTNNTRGGVSVNTLLCFKTRAFFALRSKCEYYFITTSTTLLTALVKRRAVSACDGRRRRRRERRLFHPRERYRAVLFWRRRICRCSRSCKTWICGLNR